MYQISTAFESLIPQRSSGQRHFKTFTWHVKNSKQKRKNRAFYMSATESTSLCFIPHVLPFRLCLDTLYPVATGAKFIAWTFEGPFFLLV